MFKKKKRGSRKYEWAKQYKAVGRISEDPPDYPHIPNTNEPVIEVIAKHNLLGVIHEYKCYPTMARCDSFDLFVDGELLVRC